MITETIRAIRTLDGGVPVYRKAYIDVARVNTDEIHPIAKYVLAPHIKRLLELKAQLDIFNLTDVIQTSDGVCIAPPVVEWSDGRWCIVDGLHRCYMARMARSDITVARVAGSDQDYPLISTPVDWADVRLLPQRPHEPRDMRNLREGIDNMDGVLRRYFRDLSVLGSSGRR